MTDLQCCTPTQQSAFTTRGKFFFAVHFDENSVVNDVSFEDRVLYNASFKNCILSNVKFINVLLQDMEFVDCNFNDYIWLSGAETDQTWTSQTFEQQTDMCGSIPEQVEDLKWLDNLLNDQVIPPKPPKQDLPPLVTPAEPWAAAESSVDDCTGPSSNDQDFYGWNTAQWSCDIPTHKRRLAAWQDFAAEQVKEREEDALSLAGDESRKVEVGNDVVNVEAEDKRHSKFRSGEVTASTDDSMVAGNGAAVRDQPLVANSGRQALGAVSGNVQGKLDPTQNISQIAKDDVEGAGTTEASKTDDDDDDVTLDGPVYVPALRRRRGCLTLV